jgi:hypothetical protein
MSCKSIRVTSHNASQASRERNDAVTLEFLYKISAIELDYSSYTANRLSRRCVFC